MTHEKNLQNFKKISEDTSRSPKERDLARVLNFSETLLSGGNFESAQSILKIYLEEFLK